MVKENKKLEDYNMKKKLIIKTFKLRSNSNDNISKIIVVGYNTSKVNGGYIEKLGTFTKSGDKFMYFLKLNRIGYWLNKGACLKSRISWIIGYLSYNKK